VKLFIDTSSLIKLYYKEDGTSNLDRIFVEHKVAAIFISEITKVEFFSAIYKKLRINQLSQQNVDDILGLFLTDLHNYEVVLINSEIINLSQMLIKKYGTQGLRALDAMQLASICSIKGMIDIAITDDKLLNEFFVLENIKTPARL
jgi:predicted nucleic acid-binding protein